MAETNFDFVVKCYQPDSITAAQAKFAQGPAAEVTATEQKEKPDDKTEVPTPD